MSEPRAWRAANVPVPEPHVAGLVVGVALHLWRPWPLPVGGPAILVAGVGLLTVGLGLAAWAVVAAGRVHLAEATTPVTSGPYRLARHPMYVGWTLA